MIGLANLPLRIENKNKKFFLHHKANGALWISRGGIFGDDPEGFHCEIPKDQALSYIDKVFNTVEQMGSGKIFSYRWSYIVHEEKNILERKRQIKLFNEAAKNNVWGIGKCEIHLDFRLSSLCGLDEVKALCGSKDQAFVGLCDFRVMDQSLVEVSVSIKAEGYRLLFTLKDPAGAQMINDVLGIELEEID